MNASFYIFLYIYYIFWKRVKIRLLYICANFLKIFDYFLDFAASTLFQVMFFVYSSASRLFWLMVNITVHVTRWSWLLIFWRRFTLDRLRITLSNRDRTRLYEIFIITIIMKNEKDNTHFWKYLGSRWFYGSFSLIV